MKVEEYDTKKKKKANDARLQAIRRKAEEKEIADNQIKNSLKDLDNIAKRPTHITFSDSDDSSEETDSDSTSSSDNGQKQTSKNPNSDKLLGFGSSSDSSDDDDIQIKPQFQGKRGEKLLELQASYGNDKRFRLDERFADAVEEQETSAEKECTQDDDESRSNADLKDEMSRNMDVLAKIVGNKVKEKKSTANFIDTTSRRYDPTKNTNLEIKSTIVEKTNNRSENKKKKVKEEMPQVDSRRFYETTSDVLKNVFGAKNDEKDQLVSSNDPKPFSVLAMLGQKEDPSEGNEATMAEEAAIVTSNEDSSPHFKFKFEKDSHKYPTLKRTFEHDSSDTDEEDEIDTLNFQDKLEMKDSQAPGKKVKMNENVPKSFFMKSPQDPRLIAGVREFCLSRSYEELQQEWLAVKDNLIQDYKKKHRDAKRKAKIEAKQLKFQESSF